MKKGVELSNLVELDKTKEKIRRKNNLKLPELSLLNQKKKREEKKDEDKNEEKNNNNKNQTEVDNNKKTPEEMSYFLKSQEISNTNNHISQVEFYRQVMKEKVKVEEMYDLEDNLVYTPRGYCTKCVFQIK